MPAPHDLSIRQLQYVVAVAETLGFHRAAERCHVSQPALSAQIQQLEAVLGVRLFERDKRRVLVTPAGAEVVERAKRALVEVGDLIATSTRMGDPFEGTLRVGVIPTVAPYLLPEVMPAIARRWPRLRLVLREEKTADIVEALDDGALDAGLLAMEAEVGECAHAEVARDPFVVALPKGHPLAKKKAVRAEDLDTCSVLLLEDGHCFRSQALALCARVGAREADYRATSLATLAQMVSSGAGVTLLPAMAVPVENRRAQLEIRPFVGSSPRRTISLVWRPRSPFAPALRELAATLRTAAAATPAISGGSGVRRS